jgi:hypothetical protein
MHFHYFHSAHLNVAFNGGFMGEGDTQEPNVRFRVDLAYKMEIYAREGAGRPPILQI